MKQNTVNHTPYYNRSGIYKLTCNTCKLAYVGQTSRSLKLRLQEHIRYIRYNNPQSAYAQHILQHRHEYGPIDHLMTILKPLNDTALLTPYEQYFIQTLYQKRTANSWATPRGKKPPNPTGHWLHPHTTCRNQSSSFLHTFPRSEPLPTTKTGTYLEILFNLHINPTYQPPHFPDTITF